MNPSVKNIIFRVDWYEAGIHMGLLEYAKGRNWLIHANHHARDMITNFKVDGLVTSNQKSPADAARLIDSLNAPSVTLFGEASSRAVPSILLNDRAIGESAATAFINRGFSNFAILFAHPFAPPPPIAKRIEGFEEKVRQINGNMLTVYRGIGKKKTSANMELRNKAGFYKEELQKCNFPLAVFLTGDDSAPLLQSTCFELGLSIPQDVAMISVNNDQMICPYTPVPLSSVDPGWKRMGYLAGALLDKLMRGETVKEPQYSISPLGVVERMSSSILAVEDRRVADALIYITNNLEKDPTVDDICQGVGVSKTQLTKAFGKHLGHGIKKEVQLARIRKIKTLLLNTDMSSVQIADVLNFSSVFYLYKFFKNHTKLTPKEFRKAERLP